MSDQTKSRAADLCFGYDTHRSFGRILAVSTSLKAGAVPLGRVAREHTQFRETRCNARRRPRYIASLYYWKIDRGLPSCCRYSDHPRVDIGPETTSWSISRKLFQGERPQSGAKELTLLYVSKEDQRAWSNDEFRLFHRLWPVTFKDGLDTAHIPGPVLLEKEVDLCHEPRSMELSAWVAALFPVTGCSRAPAVVV